MLTFSTETANEAWIEAFKALQDDKQAIVTPSRGGDTRDLLHAVIAISNPRQRWVLSRYPVVNPAFALAEVVWIMTGRQDTEFLTHWFSDYHNWVGGSGKQHAAYGQRLRHHFGFDQLVRAYKALKSDPDSRQVNLQIWCPTADMPHPDGKPQSGDIPCNLMSCLKIRNKKLSWIQVMRSNDIDRGLPHNFVQFTSIQEIMAGWLGVDVGEYLHVADSLHLYTKDSARHDMDNKIKVANNTDRFVEPMDESLEIFNTLANRAEQLIDFRANGQLNNKFNLIRPLPQAYENIWAVMAADDARSAGDQDRAAELIAQCNNPVLCQLWQRWHDRMVSESN